MTDIFRATADALASLLGTTSDIAGYILGTAFIVVLLIVLTWVLGEYAQGYGFIIVGAIGFIFAVLVGWFPLWTIILIALVVVLTVLHPGSDRSVGG